MDGVNAGRRPGVGTYPGESGESIAAGEQAPSHREDAGRAGPRHTSVCGWAQLVFC